MTKLSEISIANTGPQIHKAMVEVLVDEGVNRGYEHSYDLLLAFLNTEIVFSRIVSQWEKSTEQENITKLQGTITGVFESITEDSRKPIIPTEINYFTGMSRTQRAIVGTKAALLTKFYQEVL